MIKLYNTATHKLETFKPLGDVVKIYTCGPTVYNYPHIGNFAAYTFWDLLVRTLRANNYKVKRVLNLTDVGHLVSDSDEGEDKLEKTARIEGKTPFEVADYYSKIYLDYYDQMEFLPPDILARATDYVIADQHEVDLMTKNGFTYETRDGVYYDTAKFPDYAKFARLDLKGLKAGARVEFSSEKRNPSDFAVWKFIQPGEKHAMRWDYLGRPGYPGWHLECSTIIHETLGEPIDIHTGGIDHIPIHHTNEIAQTYAATGHSLAKYWLHCEFITIDGQKISKSLGNTYTLDDLAERGFSAMDFKMWLLSGHYQGTRNFTFEGLEAAHNRRENWRARIAECYQNINQAPKKTSESNDNSTHHKISNSTSNSDNPFTQILSAINQNLNSAEAFKIIDTTELTLSNWQKIDDLLGLRLLTDTPDISPEQYDLIHTRDQARQDKDFAKSDQIRDELLAQGIAIKDTPSGGLWSYVDNK